MSDKDEPKSQDDGQEQQQETPKKKRRTLRPLGQTFKRRGTEVKK